MKCHYLLYSRSITKDYRWMLVPPGISTNDLKLLRELFYVYDDIKEKNIIKDSRFPPLFGLNLSSAAVLITLIQTEHQDAYSRPIFCLQGIAIPHPYKKDFSSVIQYLLEDYKNILDAWQDIDLRDADQLRNAHLDRLIIVDELQETVSQTLSMLKQEDHLDFLSGQTVLSCDDVGFEELIRYAVSPNIPIFNFAFAVATQMLHVLSSIKLNVIAPLTWNRHLSEESTHPAMSNHIKDTNDKFSKPSNSDLESFKDETISFDKTSVTTSASHSQPSLPLSTLHNETAQIKITRSQNASSYISRNLLGKENFHFILVDNNANIITESKTFSKPKTWRHPSSDMEDILSEFVDQIRRQGWQIRPGKGENWLDIKFYR